MNNVHNADINLIKNKNGSPSGCVCGLHSLYYILWRWNHNLQQLLREINSTTA